MKKIFKYFGLFLSVVLVGALSSCARISEDETADLGLGIKVFFPTKVVAGQPMTVNGSGFSDVTEIEFPGGVKVTGFELVSNEMIRVLAPAGISAGGGALRSISSARAAGRQNNRISARSRAHLRMEIPSDLCPRGRRGAGADTPLCARNGENMPGGQNEKTPRILARYAVSGKDARKKWSVF